MNMKDDKETNETSHEEHKEEWVALTQEQWDRFKSKLSDSIKRGEEAEKKLEDMIESKVPDKGEWIDSRAKYLKKWFNVKEPFEEKSEDDNKEPKDEEGFSDEDIEHAFNSFAASVKEEGCKPCERTFIKNEYNTNRGNPPRPANPLFNAAYEGKFELLKMLLENKEELNSIGIKLNSDRYKDTNEEISDGRGPLLLEAVNGLVALVKRMMPNVTIDDFISNIEKYSEEFNNIFGRIVLINYLIARSLYIKDDLYWSLEHEYYDSFKILMYFFKIDGVKSSCQRNDSEGKNPLFSTTNTEFLKDLVILGYDINAVNDNGDTVFMLNKDVCNYFLTYSQMNYHVKNKKGQTLLYRAIKWEDKTLVNIMITKRLSMNDIDIDGRSPLDYAIFLGNYSIVKLLLDNGAYLFNKDSIAIKEGRWGTLKENNHNCYKIMRELRKLEGELND